MCRKRSEAKGDRTGYFFLLRSPLGNHSMPFSNVIGHVFCLSPSASPLLQQSEDRTKMQSRNPKIGHFLRGRSLKGRCNIRVSVCSCVFLYVCVCVSPLSPCLRSPHEPAHTVGLNSRIPPPHLHMTLPVPASVPASNRVTYPWEGLPLKKCLTKTLSREMPENSRKFRASPQKYGMPRKEADPGNSGNYSGDPQWAFWDDFPWWMRTAKVDMLGTGDELQFELQIVITTKLPFATKLLPY